MSGLFGREGILTYGPKAESFQKRIDAHASMNSLTDMFSWTENVELVTLGDGGKVGSSYERRLATQTER